MMGESEGQGSGAGERVSYQAPSRGASFFKRSGGGSRWRGGWIGWVFGLIVRLAGLFAFMVAILVTVDMRNADLRDQIVQLQSQVAEIRDPVLMAAVKQIADARSAGKSVPQFMVVDANTAGVISSLAVWGTVDNDKDLSYDNTWDECLGSVFTSITEVDESGCTANQILSKGGLHFLKWEGQPAGSLAALGLPNQDPMLYCNVKDGAYTTCSFSPPGS